MTRIPRPPSAHRLDLRGTVGGGRGIRSVGLNRLAQENEPKRLCKLNSTSRAGGLVQRYVHVKIDVYSGDW
jgi:hypothetical protein